MVEHLLKTKDALIYEANNPKINSRRFAALKAISIVLYRMRLHHDLNKLETLFGTSKFSTFLQEVRDNKGNLSFNRNDQNLFGKDYFILG